MTADPRVTVVSNWWLRAEESLRSAKLEFDAGSLAFAINRIYYAAFYAVTAALLDRKLSFKRHSGVRKAFHDEFIRSGLLGEQWGKFYDQLFEDRQEGDYVVTATFDRDYVQDQLEACSAFLSALRGHVSIVPRNE